MSPELHVAANTERTARTGRRNGWAVASFIFGCLPFCAPLSFLAPVIGIWALLTLQRRPGMRGHVMATLGIILGLLGSTFWITVAVGIRAPLLDGPTQAMHACETTDIDAFRSSLAGAAAETDEAEILAFMAAVNDRYGGFIACGNDPDREPSGAPWLEEGMLVPYQMVFEDGAVAASVRVEIDGLAARFTEIRLIDPILGDLGIPRVSDPETQDSESETTGSADTVED